MAGDWIKMRVGLTTNPRVMRIAECLIEDADFLQWAGLHYGVPNYPPVPEADIRAERHAALRVTRYVTVTALLRWWGYANEHAKGEFIAGVFPEDVDEITGVPGFAGAIEAAGWVEFDPDGGVSLPNFREHNTSADARSSGAERQKRYREKHRQCDPASDAESDVTRDVTVTHREEKSREEKKKEKRAPRQPKSKTAETTLADWIGSLDGGDAVPAGDPLFDWADKQGIPPDWLALAWAAFEDRYAGKDKTYADWRAAFRDHVKRGWLDIWRVDARSGGYVLTTVGEQWRREVAA